MVSFVKFGLPVYVLTLLSQNVYSKKKASEEEEEDADAGTSKKKLAKTTIDTSQLEGSYTVNFYYNNTDSKIVARTCSTVSELKWIISGTSWTQSIDGANPSKDILFNSNGKWTIKEIIVDDSINYAKFEVYKDNTDLIKACSAWKRSDDGTVNFMFNFTNPETCPQKMMFFADVCSNQVDFAVATCNKGKCTKNGKEDTDSSDLSFNNYIGLNFLYLLPILSYQFL